MKKYLVSLLLPLFVMAVLLLTGCEGWTSGDNPDTGKPVKSLSIKKTDSKNLKTDFEYDAQGRISKIVMTEQPYNAEAYEAYYSVSYNDDSVSIKESLYGNYYNTYTFTLNDAGRATHLLCTGPVEGDRLTIDLSYSTKGQIVKEEWNDGDYVNYTWTNRDLTHVSYRGLSEYDFHYSEHPNTANIDLNWLLTAGYSVSGVFPLGILDLIGTRSAHYVIPNWSNAQQTPIPSWKLELPVREDLINTTVTDTYTTTSSVNDETTAEYQFDTDGDLTSILTEIHKYEITWERTGTITLFNPDSYEERDGVKYYWDVVVVQENTKEISRKPIESQCQEVIITY